jgi:hypothetical protein
MRTGLYAITGAYHHNDTDHQFTGELRCVRTPAGNYRFEGNIVDPDSRVPEQEILGAIRFDGVGPLLALYKMPPDPSLTDILYGLQKNGPSIEGEYIGAWAPCISSKVTTRRQKDAALSSCLIAMLPLLRFDTPANSRARLVLRHQK